MIDPLADPRAPDLLAAVPDDVATLAVSFRAAAGESELTATGLAAAQHDATWTGSAADRFHSSIGRLPGELERVRAGYAAVAGALGAYEPELARIQAAFVRTVAALADARTRLAGARTACRQAQGELQARAQLPHPSFRTLRSSELAVARADGALEGCHSEVAALTRTALSLLDEFVAVRRSCRDAVAAAQSSAPVRPREWPGAVWSRERQAAQAQQFHHAQQEAQADQADDARRAALQGR